MTPILDVATVQQALDALVTGDLDAASVQFTGDLVLTGPGGCLDGRTDGLAAVLDRFAEMSRVTRGSFGTEVEAVYTGATAQLVAVTRHWAMLEGDAVRAIQALVLTTEGDRFSAVDVLSGSGPRSGIWD